METKVFDLGIGEFVEIDGRGGWKYRLTKAKKGFDLKSFNPGKDGVEIFFSNDTAGNPYGAPMTVQEPGLGIPFFKIGIAGVGNPIKDRLVGVLVMDESGKIVERLSLTNFIKIKGAKVEMEGRLLVVDGTPKGYLNAIFEADKNRMHGHVGIFQPEHTGEEVTVLEMESLIERAVK